MLAELARVLRVPLGELVGQPVLMEDDRQQDDVPAVRDALSRSRKLAPRHPLSISRAVGSDRGIQPDRAR